MVIVKETVDGEEHKGGFGHAGCVLFLDLGVGYTNSFHF